VTFDAPAQRRSLAREHAAFAKHGNPHSIKVVGMDNRGATKRDCAKALLILTVILNSLFLPCLWGGKTLLMSAQGVASIVATGAYGSRPVEHGSPVTPDAGAPAWFSEPAFQIVADQYWREHSLPVWNPYAAYGTPLAAAMQPAPFYPLTVLLSTHLSPRTYDLFVVARLLIAGLLAFLFARLFIAFLPALFSGVTFMLSGYFILYLDMPHLNVEILIPGVLLVFELVLRTNSWRAVAAAAIVIFVCMTGGMPESQFLVIAFGCIYGVFRLLSCPDLRERLHTRLAKLALAIFLGFALSSFLLLPFLEFLHLSHNTHQSGNLGGHHIGIEFDGNPRDLIVYLLPLIFGPLNQSMLAGTAWSGTRGYWAIIPLIFALLATICLFFLKKSLWPNSLRSLTLFFAGCLSLMLLKHYGSPLVNWVGTLPIANLIVYVKYQEPLMGFCVAMLGGIGFAVFLEGRLHAGYSAGACFGAVVIVLGLAGWSLPEILLREEFADLYFSTLVVGVSVIAIALLLLVLPRPSMARVARTFAVLLCLDLSLNFMLPSFYLFGSPASAKANPYAGAPYLDFLRGRDNDYSRVFAREGVLFPNWAGVFRLPDVRALDAMYYRRYFDFIRNFLLKQGDEKRWSGDLADRFTGADGGYAYGFETQQERRFLTLSSVKYLLAGSAYGASVINEIAAQHGGENVWGLDRVSLRVADDRIVPGLLQHPPSTRVTYKTVIDPERPIFTGIAAIKPEAQDKSDGVGFLLEIRDGDHIEKVFSTFLNPKSVSADRDGRPFRIDLASFGGRQVELLFSTDPGPRGDNSWDWAGWAGLQFVSPTQLGEPQFKQVYNDEVLIYEVPDVLPRASLFHAVEILPDEQVLARLKARSFDPEQAVIMSRESLAAADTAVLESLAAAPPTRVTAAHISSYESQRVRIEAVSDAPALLMLNDTNYPGWRAYVNGQPTPVVAADYLFRGVVIPAGSSVVEFSYEPTSLRIGFAISLVSMIIVGILMLHGARWRRAGEREKASLATQ